MTLVRDGEVVEVAPFCSRPPPCERVERVLLTDAAVRAAATNAIPPLSRAELGRVRIDDLTWLSPFKVAVLLRIPAPRGGADQHLIAGFVYEQLKWTYPLADSSRDELVAGPRGQRVWAGGDAVFTSDGFRLPIPNGFRRSQAAAWSPDEQWLALAAGDTIAFVRPGVAEPVLTVPIDAADLAWR